MQVRAIFLVALIYVHAVHQNCLSHDKFRHHWRFEFQLQHWNLSTTLITDKKLWLGFLHSSYNILAWERQRLLIQSTILLNSESFWILKKDKNIESKDQLLLMTLCFLLFWTPLFSTIEPNFWRLRAKTVEAEI